METSDLLKRVRQIEIKTRGLSNNIFAGQYHSAFKGKGMSFSEVREYQYGDDVRDIDWNVTARYNKPFVKVFEEERELTVMLLIDVSNSLDFGTVKQLKKDMVTEIAATWHSRPFKITIKSELFSFQTGLRNSFRLKKAVNIFFISSVNCLISSPKASVQI